MEIDERNMPFSDFEQIGKKKKRESERQEKQYPFLPVASALPESSGLESWAEGKISVLPTPAWGPLCPVQAGCLLISYQLVNLKLEIQGLNVAHGLIICLLGLGTFLSVQKGRNSLNEWQLVLNCIFLKV